MKIWEATHDYGMVVSTLGQVGNGEIKGALAGMNT
jgi:hypothetical protein